MKALGTHVYAGGFALGVAKHFDIVAHFEESPFGVATIERNFNFPVYQDYETWPATKYKGLDLIYCNPPCSAWSVCNPKYVKDWENNPILECLHHSFELLEKMRPKVWMFESVRGAYTKGMPLLIKMEEKARELNYRHVYYVYTDGLEHGLAQMRRRFFMVVSKKPIIWHPTGCTTKPTVGQVINRAKIKNHTLYQLNPERVEWQRTLLKKAKPGERLTNVFNRVYKQRVKNAEAAGKRVIGRPSFQVIKLDPDGICPTMTRDPHQLHWSEHRYLSVEERKALCGFPKSYRLEGGVLDQYGQLVKGVMPPTAEYMARQVRSSLAERSTSRKPTRLFVEVFSDRVHTEEI